MLSAVEVNSELEIGDWRLEIGDWRFKKNKIMILKTRYIVICLVFVSCMGTEAKMEGSDSQNQNAQTTVRKIEPGITFFDSYLPSLENKKVAIVANHTSLINGVHLVDTLRSVGIDVTKVFAPEHGFRGDKDAGENIVNGNEDGLEIISLHGKDKKPRAEDLAEIDVVIFDIQDVGVRFYTYLSTLHYVMESCAENDKKLIVLDRPNPNAHYVDGPVLKTNQRSFIGLHPVPIVYGLTIGEYAKMINGEKWLDNQVVCNLTVIPCQNYDHKSIYELPIAPSPNLPNLRSIYLYPSLAIFEGTEISIGRGTDTPFQLYGHPDYPNKDFSFTPKSGYGAKYPKLENKKCFGADLKSIGIDTLRIDSINLTYFFDMYKNTPNKKKFFLENNFFNKLTGNALLMSQIKKNLPESEIRASWNTDLNIYLRKRQKYLIYED
ncbi:MAG: hypothetical protein ACI81Y_000944 [Glaciecola sp.]|jgi:uncharacterized protein YbbC (DUF1343 family)